MGLCHSGLQSCGCFGDDLTEKLLATVAAVNSDHAVFPQSAATCGLCASGGGARAMTFTLGILRGLHNLNLLGKLEAISSVSGGTWVCAPFMFGTTYNGSPIDTAQMVGAATQPSKLFKTTLASEAAPLGVGWTKNNSTDILLKFALQGPTHMVWQRTVSLLGLSAFGLDNFDAFMSLTGEQKTRIIKDNPALSDKTFFIPRNDRPKVFIINGALLSPLGYRATGENVVSLQMCPDYTGCPFYPNNAKVTYPRARACLRDCCKPMCIIDDYGGCCSQTRIVGGGFVESFAFGGAAPNDATGGEKVPVGYPAAPLSLSQAVGISSMAIAAELANSNLAGKVANPREEYWPITSLILPGPQAATIFQVGDGGELDNSGLLSLLQRGVKKVVWIASSYRALSGTYDYAHATVDNFDPEAALVIDQVYDKFGYGYENAGNFLANNQVFGKSLLLGLIKNIVDLKEAGKPAIVQQSFAVMQNDWWGIPGGHSVDIVLIYLESVKEFTSQLPPETQDELSKGNLGEFKNYPNYSTSFNNEGDALGLTSPQVNLLAAQAEYSVMQNSNLFQTFLN